ncbi:NUDIX hydrolase [Nocardioides anomalus]|uniref:NUDIX hydrolase n=1 Tax=Nocardioides anomalus TaxID=2712223 RepID=A0A6G6WKC5_9ACTN|nr:NUDIX hydrolase [Nocardioides anomalus]
MAAYAVIIRDDRILLSRLAKRLTAKELWTLPGGGLEHGEDPRDAVVREVHEETGLDVQIGETAHVYSYHQRNTWRQGRRADAHALRIVYDGWVPVDSPEPHVVEVDGSTMDAAWQPLAGVLDGSVPTVGLVTEVLAEHRPFRLQRVAAYALAVRDDRVLLTRISARGAHPRQWTLPGGGLEHGEDPRAAVVREVREETGLACTPGNVLDVVSTHFEGTAPSGRREDFHALQVVYAAEVADGDPEVQESDGTADEAAWVPLAELDALEVRPVVRAALAARLPS